jgi:hypothetical protein
MLNMVVATNGRSDGDVGEADIRNYAPIPLPKM